MKCVTEPLIKWWYTVPHKINDYNSVALDMGKKQQKKNIFLDHKRLVSTGSSENFEYCFMAWSSNSTLSGLSTKFSQDLGMSIPSTVEQNGHVVPSNHGQIHYTEGAPPIGNWHLSSVSTKIKSWPLKLLTFNTPERNSGWKLGMRHSVLWKNWQKWPPDN